MVNNNPKEKVRCPNQTAPYIRILQETTLKGSYFPETIFRIWDIGYYVY